MYDEAKGLWKKDDAKKQSAKHGNNEKCGEVTTGSMWHQNHKDKTELGDIKEEDGKPARIRDAKFGLGGCKTATGPEVGKYDVLSPDTPLADTYDLGEFEAKRKDLQNQKQSRLQPNLRIPQPTKLSRATKLPKRIKAVEEAEEEEEEAEGGIEGVEREEGAVEIMEIPYKGSNV
ncbi:unnamed protein product [Clonostachys solani]|uniref:Uncharacterized protein n=1 Tax=Clonostachys solani TaxID=160281 RepID=A0A9P0EKE6_9HYPO|nr:unnamed protein product [Clonostachys solani]